MRAFAVIFFIFTLCINPILPHAYSNNILVGVYDKQGNNIKQISFTSSPGPSYIHNIFLMNDSLIYQNGNSEIDILAINTTNVTKHYISTNLFQTTLLGAYGNSLIIRNSSSEEPLPLYRYNVKDSTSTLLNIDYTNLFNLTM